MERRNENETEIRDFKGLANFLDGFIGAWANTALCWKEAAEVLALLEARQCVSFGFRVSCLNLGLSKYAVILHLSSRSTSYPLTRNPSNPNQALDPKSEAKPQTRNPKLSLKP